MKIVYCIPQLYRPGGIERIVSIKANYLAEVYRYEVTMVVADQQGKEAFYKISPRVKIVDLGLDYDGTLALPIMKRLKERGRLHRLHREKLERILMDERPNITVSTFTHEASFLPDIKDGSKKVLEFHFCRGHKRRMADAFGFPITKRLAYYFKCWQEENIIIPKYDQFVVLTNEDRELWQTKIKNVVNMPNALSFETDETATLDGHSAIAVGRLDAQKGFDRLIDIWHDVNKAMPDWTLHIYGQGSDEALLKAQIHRLGLDGKTIIHEPNSNIKSCYLDSSIFVMTSHYEGLPMTLLEATGLGLPSVCYDFKCGPRDVIVDGENGFLVKEGDALSLKQSLLRLMSDKALRQKMGQKAKQRSMQYERKKVMEKWNALFQSLIKEQR